ncbi:MAG: hypothetical protein JO131_04435 [Gammaproteobacteria bacterium]|nr:hypothetical protein [Gammaproteobacteria bacterium]
MEFLSFLLKQKNNILLGLIVLTSIKIFTKQSKQKSPSSSLKMISYFNHLKDVKKYKEKPFTVSVIDKKGVVNTVKVEEIEKIHQFRWKEDVFVSSDCLYFATIENLFFKHPLNNLSITWGASCLSAKFQHYFENIDSYNNKMALINMGDLGFGVVAKDEFKKDDAIIGFYAGEVIGDGYRSREARTYAFKAYIGKQYVSLDAKAYGNLTRFMPHLPKKEELKSQHFPGINIENVATANLKIVYARINTCSFPAFQALEPIEPKQIMGFSYGSGYWMYKPFWLLDKNGSKIIEVKYDVNNEYELVPNKPYLCC